LQLQKFVTDVIEGLGGVVIPVEYALCQVLIPESYQSYFQDKTELELAFDFEVAQENPQSEFVTFGSYILEQVLTLANQKAVSTLRFAEVERFTLADPIKKITDSLKEINGRITILNETEVMGVWAVFQFHIALVSDEKEEKTEQIWVNMITGEVSERMKQEQNRIIFKSEPLYHYPIPTDLNIESAFKSAYGHAKASIKTLQQKRIRDPQLQKDIDRIESYYKELLSENERKATRKGITEEKAREISAKTKAIELEMDKQIQEIRKKYHGRIEIVLDHGIMYFVPMLQYNISIHFRSEHNERTLYYNPITKEFVSGKTVTSPSPS
jgi:hypothetical protein